MVVAFLRRSVGALFAGGICLIAVPAAFAQAGRDPVAADTLFQQARLAKEKGDSVTACAKFAESYRLDPTAGTLMNVATCEEDRGELATSWLHWREAIEQLGDRDERVAFAKKREAALAPRVPKLSVKLKAGSPAGTSVKRGDVTLGAASLGVELPVNPGRHTVTARAEGYEIGTTTLELKPGESRTVEIGVGARGAQAPLAKPDPVAAPAQIDTRKSTSSTPTLGWTLLGVGAVGVIAGSVTGLMLISKRSDAESNCNAAHQCNTAGLDAASSGKSLVPINTVSWAVGLLATGAGAYLVLTHRGAETAVSAAPSPSGLTLAMRRTF